MQIGFAGSPQLAATTLEALLESGRRPDIVLTQPPRRSGRRRAIQRTPVHELADANGLEVVTPVRLKGCDHLVDTLDLLVVAAYGLILPRSILEAPRLGCINVHPSLLPRWRGASPVEHAILHGDTITGVSIMRVQPALDSGPVYATSTYEMKGNETTASLTLSLARIGAKLLLEVMGGLDDGSLPCPTPQDSSMATYARQLRPEQARMDWSKPATILERHVRAFLGRSPAFTTKGDIRLRILCSRVVEGFYTPGSIYRQDKSVIVGCGQGGLELNTVQLNRGKGTPLSIASALNGYGEVFAGAFA